MCQEQVVSKKKNLKTKKNLKDYFNHILFYSIYSIYVLHLITLNIIIVEKPVNQWNYYNFMLVNLATK